MKATFQRTTILAGLSALAGLFVALTVSGAQAQCYHGAQYYQPPVYVYRAWLPPSGCYPYYGYGCGYGAPVYIPQYAGPPATPQPGPGGWRASADGTRGLAAPGNQSAAEPKLVPATPAEPRSHGPAKAEAVAPSDLPPPASTDAQTLAQKQRICPVTGKPLGSMGEPYKVRARGRDVLLCCQGCEAKFTSDPDKYLAKLNN